MQKEMRPQVEDAEAGAEGEAGLGDGGPGGAGGGAFVVAFRVVPAGRAWTPPEAARLGGRGPGLGGRGAGTVRTRGPSCKPELGRELDPARRGASA